MQIQYVLSLSRSLSLSPSLLRFFGTAAHKEVKFGTYKKKKAAKKKTLVHAASFSAVVVSVSNYL